MKKTGFNFNFGKHLDNLDDFKKHFLDKMNKVQEKILNRKGPNLFWMEELEDDTAIVLPESDFSTGIPTLSRLWNDFESGLVVIGGEPNVGKSSLIIQMIHHLLRLQDDVIVVDISLDDPITKRYVQLICNISGLHYQEIYNLSQMDEDKTGKYNKAKEVIDTWIDESRYWPFEPSESFAFSGKSIDAAMNTLPILVDLMESMRAKFPKHKIVFLIDAINDLDFEVDDNSSVRQDKFIKELKHNLNANDIMAVAAAHIRKNDSKGKTIRPEDIKGTKETFYSAVYTGILRNEYRENCFADPLMIERGGKLYPILTMACGKNKVSGWDGVWMCGLIPGQCRVFPLTKQEYLKSYALYTSART